MNLFQLTDSDRNRIHQTCAAASEKQVVDMLIENYESKGTYEYTIETTGAVYLIQQGWIAQVTPHTDGTGVLRSVNAEGQKIGSAAADIVMIGSTVIEGGEELTADDACGAEVKIYVTGTDLGQVIVGAAWDDISCGEKTFTVNRIGEQKIVQLRLPQYMSRFQTGNHNIMWRFGHYAGHDVIDGDVITWDLDPAGMCVVSIKN